MALADFDAQRPSPLIDCATLYAQLQPSNAPVILDASFFLPAEQRNAAAEYAQCHLPGAQFFDIDQIADRSNPLPHMLPSSSDFAAAIGALGIDADTDVVVYDNNRYMASARAWWMFRVFGYARVKVLDGGLKRWRALDLPVCSDPSPAPTLKAATAEYHPELVCDLAAMRQLADTQAVPVLDARSAGRFYGRDPEPRAGLRSGHIPGSRSLPSVDLIDPDTGVLRAPEALAQRFEQAGIDTTQAAVTTCGTGVTAAIVALALYRLGQAQVAVYDGSWTEWGGRSDTPVVCD